MYIYLYILLVAKSYSVADARAKLAEIVDDVESGAEVEITRRGRKVAILLSPAKYARMRGERLAFLSAYEIFRGQHDLTELGVERGWAGELRDRRPGRAVKL